MAYMFELVEKVRRISEGAALITGAELSFIFSEKPSFDMITNYPLARRIKVHLDDLGLQMPEARAEEGRGSTDWGNVSYEIPSVETSYPIINRVCTWHSQEVVDASDSALGYDNTITVAKGLALAGDRCPDRSRPSGRDPAILRGLPEPTRCAFGRTRQTRARANRIHCLGLGPRPYPADGPGQPLLRPRSSNRAVLRIYHQYSMVSRSDWCCRRGRRLSVRRPTGRMSCRDAARADWNHVCWDLVVMP